MSKKAAYHHILAIYRGGSENDVLLFFALILTFEVQSLPQHFVNQAKL